MVLWLASEERSSNFSELPRGRLILVSVACLRREKEPQKERQKKVRGRLGFLGYFVGPSNDLQFKDHTCLAGLGNKPSGAIVALVLQMRAEGQTCYTTCSQFQSFGCGRTRNDNQPTLCPQRSLRSSKD
jgi:hypothetical protein